MATEGYFRIGAILKPKGLKGELNIYTDFEGLEKIKFQAVFIEIAGSPVPFFVKSIKYLQKNAAYLVLEDVDTIEKAAPLGRKELYLPNKLKPKKKKPEFTLFDLEGFTAVDVNEGELGVVTAVHEYPRQIIAAVDFKGKEILFPLNEAIIKGIDPVSEVLTVDLPEGLLDVYLD
jgi:16S rRNA processing protein RimM